MAACVQELLELTLTHTELLFTALVGAGSTQSEEPLVPRSERSEPPARKPAPRRAPLAAVT